MSIIPGTDTHYARCLLSSPPPAESQAISRTITTLQLQSHIEGGYFHETDRDRLLVPNPFKNLPLLTNATSKDTSDTRNASTTIYYFLSPKSPVGRFHRNRGRTVHTLHWGRGRYVILHSDQRDSSGSGEVPIETFVVGKDIQKGEKVQWIVEGGKFKASFLLPDDDKGGDDATSEQGLLISETVVPGFDYADHDFMTAERMAEALGSHSREELKWLLNADEQQRLEGVLEEMGKK
ncbi:uncharacterized protein Z520_05621 [Fonsecaea multimorphosa CBS 102226]|uniref:DUF985 domain-containing protein n=1 Tax=Fonsecaea multimorphosa CBS 102226 TaxID=1442371 RepID=A0A0D2H8X5_9EURO|nr:uncharacterized protein Z520_05621 [Fonsecaea multimorphosa CBS 102226]KIX98320.1 hypothetical protein Z520_05621 [Fonsecaea multimorphosa CBS 102226]OAL24515.1 hypothetical protein AYO22_05304 [Fonsecaea multimorphosa]